MKRIFPINESNCKSLYGKTVFLFLEDGSEFVGTLSKFEKNQLILNDKSAREMKTTGGKRAAQPDESPSRRFVLETEYIAALYSLDD